MASLVLAAMLAAITNAPAGVIQGQLDGDVLIWRGIPYAQPPVGPLRWRAPQPLSRSPFLIRATQFGAICPQADPKGDTGVGAEAQDEDCLTLNVWAPAKHGARRPVMVWIHGGGYINGSGSAALYDGSALARRGVIVVTLNYRLGHLGFFAHRGLAKREGSNFGLLDQRAALVWVRNNIRAFGGDPKQVTMFGNSAGGESVLFHMTSAGSRGLFARAIIQSGLGGRALQTAEASVDQRWADLPIAKLRLLATREILAWGTPSLYRGFGPTIDGKTISEPIEASFRANRQAQVPLIIGYNSFEFPPAFLGGKAAGAALVGHNATERARGIAAYGGAAAYEQRIASDALFVAPARRLAQLHSGNGQPTWAYEFDVLSPAVAGKLSGAPHASERAYVFGTLPRLGWLTDAQDAAISDELGNRWVRFAKAGAPTAVAGGWPRALPTDTRRWIVARGPSARVDEMSPALKSYFGIR